MNPRLLSRDLVVVVGSMIGFWVGRVIVTGQGALYLILTAGVLAVAAVARWPSLPIVVYYPLIWIFWSYYIPGIGQPEKLVGVLAIFGMLVLVLLKHHPLPALPPFVTAGLSLILGSYLVSAWAHPFLPNALEYVISLSARVILLYLVYFHLRTRDQLRYVVYLYIVATVVAAISTLLASFIYGFGFFRVPSERAALEQSLGPLLVQAVYSANHGGPAALLLLGLYPVAYNRRQRLAIPALALFLFWMAFVSQYRREVLVSVPVLLMFFVISQRTPRLWRPAALMLLVSVILFFSVALPSSKVLQDHLHGTIRDVRSAREIRVRNLLAELSAISRSPLIGYGPGAHALAIAPFLGPGALFLSGFNTFGWIAVEAGVFALVGFVLVLLGIYRESREYQPVEERSVEAWVLRCAPVLVLQIVLWSSFGNAWQLSMPWFLMGLILAAAHLARTTPGQTD